MITFAALTYVGVKLFAGHCMKYQSEFDTKNTHKGDCVGSVSIGSKIPMAVTWTAWDCWSDNPNDNNGNSNLF